MSFGADHSMGYSTGSESGGRAVNVLILDDEAAMVELLGEMLRLTGFSVTTCQDPIQALGLATTGDFDVILSDFRMPRMDGRAFYRALQARDPALTQRLIFLTGDTVTKDTQEFLNSTANPYLDKPFTFEEVSAAINAVSTKQPGKTVSKAESVVVTLLKMNRATKPASNSAATAASGSAPETRLPFKCRRGRGASGARPESA